MFGGRRQPIVPGSFFVATPLAVGFIRLQSIPMLVRILVAAGFVIQLTLGLSFTYAQEVADSRVAATAVAFQISAGLAGVFVAPITGDAVVSATDSIRCSSSPWFSGLQRSNGVMEPWIRRNATLRSSSPRCREALF